MTVKQAAARMEVSPGTVYQLIASGRLRCYRIGNGRGVIRIAEEHVQEYLKSAEERQKPSPSCSAPRPLPFLKHLRFKGRESGA